MIKHARTEMIGAFVLGSLALAVALVVILGSARLFRKTYRFVLFFDANVNGLRVGAPVKFRGVEIGRVTNIWLNLSQVDRAAQKQFARVAIPVLIEIDRERIMAAGAKPIDLDDPRQIDRLIQDGLRGQLALESILTGMLYVNLEMRPSTQPRLLLPKSSGYHEIPTVPTQLEQLQDRVARIVAKLNETDFRGFIDSTKRTSDSVREFVESPQVRGTIESMQSTLDNMNQTLTQLRGLMKRMNAKMDPLMSDADKLMVDTDRATKQADATFGSLQASIEPNSPLAYKLNRTLDEVSATAASMRQLTDYLQRNPSALIRGRSFSPDSVPSSGTQGARQ